MKSWRRATHCSRLPASWPRGLGLVALLLVSAVASDSQAQQAAGPVTAATVPVVTTPVAPPVPLASAATPTPAAVPVQPSPAPGIAVAQEPAAAVATPASEPPQVRSDAPGLSGSVELPTPRDWLRPERPAPAAVKGDGRSWGTVVAFLIVALVGLCAVYLRRKRARSHRLGPGSLRVLSSTKVGPKAHVVSINVAGRGLLLGVTEHAVSTLGWIESKVDGDEYLLAADPDDPLALEPDARERDLAASDQRTAGALPRRKRRAGAVVPAAGPGLRSLSPPTSDRPRTFRDVLSGMLGGSPKPEYALDDGDSSPAALILAEQTRDHLQAAEVESEPERHRGLVPRETQAEPRRRTAAHARPRTEPLVTGRAPTGASHAVEAQAAGLARRRDYVPR